MKLKHEFKPVAGVEPALGVAPKVNLQTKSQKHKSLTLSLNFEISWSHYSKLREIRV